MEKTFALWFVAALSAHAGTDNGVDPNIQGTYQHAIAAENRGVALRAQGHYREARPLLEDSLRELETLAGADAPETGQARRNLAALYWSAGDLRKAEETALRADDRHILASVYLAERRYPEAVRLLLASLKTDDERTAVAAYGNLAAAALGMNQIAKAEDYARHAVALSRRALPERDPGRAVALNNLAQACRFSGEYLEAERDYREALAIWEMALGPNHPDVGRGLMNLGALYHERGREAGAEQLYLRAIEILKNADPVLTLTARNELADVYRAQLRYTESRRLARATLCELEAALPAGDPRVERARRNWAAIPNF